MKNQINTEEFKQLVGSYVRSEHPVAPIEYDHKQIMKGELSATGQLIALHHLNDDIIVRMTANYEIDANRLESSFNDSFFSGSSKAVEVEGATIVNDKDEPVTESELFQLVLEGAGDVRQDVFLLGFNFAYVPDLTKTIGDINKPDDKVYVINVDYEQKLKIAGTFIGRLVELHEPYTVDDHKFEDHSEIDVYFSNDNQFVIKYKFIDDLASTTHEREGYLSYQHLITNDLSKAVEFVKKLSNEPHQLITDMTTAFTQSRTEHELNNEEDLER